MNQKITCINTCNLLSLSLFNMPVLHTITDPVISNDSNQEKIFSTGKAVSEPGN